MPHAEKSAAEVVFCEKLAGRAETADLSHALRPGGSLRAEKFAGLVLFQVVVPVILAVLAVLPAELPVLFGIGYRDIARSKHAVRGVRSRIIEFITRFPVFWNWPG